MSRRPAGILLGVELKPSPGAGSLHRQLYVAIKDAILDGRLKPGVRLPATRVMAQDLQVSRTTILTAFGQLSAEGYLKGKIGSGTRVAGGIPAELRSQGARRPPRPERTRTIPRFSGRSRLEKEPDLSFLGARARPLRPGSAESGLFSSEIWSRLAARHWRRSIGSPDHADSLGYRPLRAAICDYVARTRSVRCEPDQVLIVCGAQQALYLSAHTLADAGDAIWMEDPGYPRARRAFQGAGLELVPVPVDGEGMVVSAGKALHPSPRLAFVTPSFQCPLGVMLGLSRRFELLELAREKGTWILEDDYFSEYRVGSKPVASLQSLDREDRVIYIGNFSKSIVPALRIGYLILPLPLVETFRRVRSALSRQPPGPDQRALAEFLAEGHLERHLRATLAVYRERQEALVTAIREEAGGLLETSPTGTGMYLVAWLRPGVNPMAAARAAGMAGIDTIPLSAFATRPTRPGLVLGYSGYSEKRIRAAVELLAGALARVRPA